MEIDLNLIQNGLLIFEGPYNNLIECMIEHYNLEKEKQKNQIKITKRYLPRGVLQLISDYAVSDSEEFQIREVIIICFLNFLFWERLGLINLSGYSFQLCVTSLC